MEGNPITGRDTRVETNMQRVVGDKEVDQNGQKPKDGQEVEQRSQHQHSMDQNGRAHIFVAQPTQRPNLRIARNDTRRMDAGSLAARPLPGIQATSQVQLGPQLLGLDRENEVTQLSSLRFGEPPDKQPARLNEPGETSTVR